jgi:hypothetical protein
LSLMSGAVDAGDFDKDGDVEEFLMRQENEKGSSIDAAGINVHDVGHPNIETLIGEALSSQEVIVPEPHASEMVLGHDLHTSGSPYHSRIMLFTTDTDDGQGWSKYGRKKRSTKYGAGKEVRADSVWRHYYHCKHIGCHARRVVDANMTNPTATVASYQGAHTMECHNTECSDMVSTDTVGSALARCGDEAAERLAKRLKRSPSPTVPDPNAWVPVQVTFKLS